MKQTFEIQESTIKQVTAQECHNFRDLLESNIRIGKFGYRFIKIKNSKSKLLEEFVYLGFTKAGNPKFGQIINYDSGIVRVQKRIGKFDGKYLSLMSGLYLKSIKEMRGESDIQ